MTAEPAPRWSTRLTLPLPPSLNNAYVNAPGRGRIATPFFKQWKRDAGWRIREQRPQRGTGPFKITLLLPDGMRGDVDNRLKPVLDVLVENRVTPDDRFARAVAVGRSVEVEGGSCIVIVEAA